MAFDYDELYAIKANALGAPTQIFVDFFNARPNLSLKILDLGCGQGRDSIFLAKLGHKVVGVDISRNGIDQLNTAAKVEGLSIQGIIADITTYQPDADFDIILIDRTLHMLDAMARIAVLERMLTCTREDAYVLIADEKSNLPAFRDIFSNDERFWNTLKDEGGYLFKQRRKSSRNIDV